MGSTQCARNNEGGVVGSTPARWDRTEYLDAPRSPHSPSYQWPGSKSSALPHAPASSPNLPYSALRHRDTLSSPSSFDVLRVISYRVIAPPSFPQRRLVQTSASTSTSVSTPSSSSSSPYVATPPHSAPLCTVPFKAARDGFFLCFLRVDDGSYNAAPGSLKVECFSVEARTAYRRPYACAGEVRRMQGLGMGMIPACGGRTRGGRKKEVWEDVSPAYPAHPTPSPFLARLPPSRLVFTSHNDTPAHPSLHPCYAQTSAFDVFDVDVPHARSSLVWYAASPTFVVSILGGRRGMGVEEEDEGVAR
ncbi:hypothetical protein R3P38DRAFT_3230462 [Favolaschia claudopus]|uniref:Uncharacterized protein n=1 Tax=Favolaschia claudopus TaxID=2862362 RepID=A0AAV9ZMY7_9AGAR